MAGVLIALDWENIRRSLPNFVETVSLEQLCAAFEGVAQKFGDYRGGTVFGDWTLRSPDARLFESKGLQAYNVLRSRSGKDRSDPAIILEVHDWVRDRPDVDTFVLGSGDSDFQELIRRARNRGKKVVICAFGDTIASELKTMTPIFPLEAELGLTPKALKPSTLPGFPTEGPESQTRTFVMRFDSLERTLPYVVLNYLRQTILTSAWGVGMTQPEIDAFVSRMLSDGLLVQYDVANPKRPGRTTPAVKLNRSHTTVVEILASTGEPPEGYPSGGLHSVP